MPQNIVWKVGNDPRDMEVHRMRIYPSTNVDEVVAGLEKAGFEWNIETEGTIENTDNA